MRARTQRLYLVTSFSLIAVFSFNAAFAALPPEIDGVALPSLAPMLERTQPAVVNVSSRTHVQVQNSFYGDPFFDRFFGGGMGGQAE